MRPLIGRLISISATISLGNLYRCIAPLHRTVIPHLNSSAVARQHDMVQFFSPSGTSVPTRRRRRCATPLVSAFLPASTLHFSLSSPCTSFRQFRSPFINTERPRRPRCSSPYMRAASDDVRQYPLSSSPMEGGDTTTSSEALLDGANAETAETAASKRAARFKVQRRIGIGFIMGAVVIAFVFSGTYPFLLGMLAVCLIGQGEYFKMVYAKGHLPAWKMALCVTTILMVCCASYPHLADVAFPVGATFICIYLLFRQKKIATIADISTTFMGLFYAGYLPSFWVRLHEYTGGYVPAQLLSISATALPFPFVITGGSLLVFWTWLAAVSSDVGAFFIGRTYGRTRFTNISPKKTVEGAVAGFICSASVSVLGAYLLKWPVWYATGAVYGVMVGVVGLFGDLFESCFKRDVGWKDSGSLFPGHGGMLDRADSYVLTAPLVYFFTTLVLPAIKIDGSRMGLQSLFLVNKAGGLIFHRKLSDVAPQLTQNDYLHLASTFHGMQLLVQQLSPEKSRRGGYGIRMLATSSYVLQAYRAETGVQFFVTADLKTDNLMDFLKEVYAIYADFVMKNPFYELDMPIKVDLWEFHLRNAVTKFNARAGGA